MKNFNLNIAFAFLFALALSACSTEDSPLNEENIAAYELSMDELKSNTAYLQVQLADPQSGQCASATIHNADQIAVFLPGEAADETHGQEVAEVIFSNERDQQKVTSLSMTENGQMILTIDGARFNVKLTEDGLAGAMAANCDQAISPAINSSSNSNVAEAAPDQDPGVEEAPKGLSKMKKDAQN